MKIKRKNYIKLYFFRAIWRSSKDESPCQQQQQQQQQSAEQREPEEPRQPSADHTRLVARHSRRHDDVVIKTTLGRLHVVIP